MKSPEPGEFWWIIYADEWQPAKCDENGWWICGLDVLIEAEQVGSQIQMEP